MTAFFLSIQTAFIVLLHSMALLLVYLGVFALLGLLYLFDPSTLMFIP